MTPEFITMLKDLVVRLFEPENLVLKEVGGQTVSARNLFHFFQAYMQIFEGGKLPEVKSMFQVESKCFILVLKV
jgi:hypothetical protein